MWVGQHESVRVGEVVWVEAEESSHGSLGGLAATVVFYGVVVVFVAVEEAMIVFVCALLPSSLGVPPIPDGTENGGPNFGRGVLWQSL